MCNWWIDGLIGWLVDWVIDFVGGWAGTKQWALHKWRKEDRWSRGGAEGNQFCENEDDILNCFL